MIEIFRTSHLAAFLVATVALSLTTRASALEPEQADLVTSVSLQLPSSFDIEEETAYIGITGCESMVRNQGKITTTWETVFDPTTTDGGELVRDFWFFSVDRGAGARIACGESGDLCTAVDDEDVDFTSSTLTVELDFTELADLEDPEECTGFDSEFFVRATVREDVDLDTNQNADARYIVDTVRPSAPSGLTAMVTEDTIDVEFEGSADQDVSRYFVFWSTSPFEGGANPDELELNRKVLGEDPSGSVSVDLTTDAVYVAVAAQDETGNFSMLSGVVESNVVETRDFWEEYRAAGGTEDGGCSTTSGGGSGWLGLLMLGLIFGVRRRRRLLRAALPLACLAVIALAPQPASAQSPTYGAFELKLGTYYPNIDSEFGGSGPFSEIFGNKNLLIGEIEVDGWIWQGFGKVGVVGSVGFSRVKGTARAADPEEQSDVSDTTTFGVIPFRTGLMYRFDWLAEHTKIPLSFNVEGGFDFYRWRVTDSNRNTAEAEGDQGSGWKSGYHFGGGVQLLLDFLDPATAAAFDLNWGINNSYIFAEYLVTKVDGFGGEGFDLSDDIWLFGLSFEF